MWMSKPTAKHYHPISEVCAQFYQFQKEEEEEVMLRKFVMTAFLVKNESNLIVDFSKHNSKCVQGIFKKGNFVSSE